MSYANITAGLTLQKEIPLTELPTGSNGVIINVPDNPLMYPLGLRPGKQVSSRGSQLFGGPVLVKVGDRQIAVSRPLANEVIIAC